MTFDKFTIKAQEAVQEAVNIAQRNGQHRYTFSEPSAHPISGGQPVLPAVSWYQWLQIENWLPNNLSEKD